MLLEQTWSPVFWNFILNLPAGERTASIGMIYWMPGWFFAGVEVRYTGLPYAPDPVLSNLKEGDFLDGKKDQGGSRKLTLVLEAVRLFVELLRIVFG